MVEASETISHINNNNNNHHHKSNSAVASSSASTAAKSISSISSLSGGDLNNNINSNKKDEQHQDEAEDSGTTVGDDDPSSKTAKSKTANNVRIRFYFIRHGESGANKWGVVAGHDDVPLTDDGINEAKLLGQSSWIHLHKRRQRQTPNAAADTADHDHDDDSVEFWRVYSSDLSRAKDTATYALIEGKQHHHVPQLILDKRLRERSYGIRQGFARSIPEEELIAIWKQYGKEPPPYETDQQLWERGRDWIIDIIKEVMDIQRLEDTVLLSTDNNNDDDENNKQRTKIYHVLVAAHAGFIREILLNLIPMSRLVEHGAKFDSKRNNKLIIPNTSISILEIPPGDPSSNGKNQPLLQDVHVVDLLNADHLQKINVYDD